MNLVYDEPQLYRMPFVRTCPRCGVKIRMGAVPLVSLLGLVVFLHSSIEVGIYLSGRYGVERDYAVIGTILVFAVPFFGLLYLLWKHGWYVRR
jgi:hypothetical protein